MLLERSPLLREWLLSGNDSFQFDIAGITQANPCVVTTSSAHGYQDNQLVRFSDLGMNMPTPRGMTQLDGNRYRITVLSTTTFSLKDPITHENIDSTGYAAYVEGGKVNAISRVNYLNNPQEYPYSDDNQYIANPFYYEA